MRPQFRITGALASLIFAVGVLGSCGPGSELPVVSEISPNPRTTSILMGQSASLSITASGTGELRYKWTASRGLLSGSTAPSVIYTAPSSPGLDNVTVEVTNKNGSTVQSIAFEVVEPAPVEAPTAVPTMTPTQTPVAPPTETATPTATATPTVTSTPVQPLMEIIPQVGSGEAFVFMNEGGQLTYRYVESEACRHSGPYGLQLTYAMSGKGNGGWGVNWDKAAAGSFNASEFSSLVMWVKGTSGGETFQIGLKDTGEREIKVESEPLVVVSASEWRQVKVSLSQFVDGGVGVASLRNINFGFNWSHGSGTICLDDITFE